MPEHGGQPIMKRALGRRCPRHINNRRLWSLAPFLLAVVSATTTARAQTDEIQVYDASIAAPGKFNLTLHNNYTPEGRTMPAFPGGIVPDKSFNGVPEWAYGVTEWYEQGLYLPLYSISRTRGASLDGVKLRELFVVPHAEDRTFFYGVNFETSYNAHYWDTRRITSEIRSIVGLHLHPIDVIVNPTFDTSYDSLKDLDFEPQSRVAWNVSPKWAVALEEYDDFGPIHRFLPGSQQSHQLFAVVDHSTRFVNIEFGVGFGLTKGSDGVTLKLILSRDLN
jgi:hypothetical protein